MIQEHPSMDNFVSRLSLVTAILFHPLLLPIYCTLLTLFGNTPYSGMPHPVNVNILTSMGLYACANPLIIIGLFVVAGKVSDLQMPTRHERILPLFLSAIAISLSLLILGPVNTPRPLLGMLAGESVILFLAALCSLFWKISLHTAGAGALLAFVCVTGMAYQKDFAPLAAVAFVVAFLTAWTRLYQKAHTPRQLIAGYALGIVVMTILLNFFMLRPVF